MDKENPTGAVNHKTCTSAGGGQAAGGFATAAVNFHLGKPYEEFFKRIEPLQPENREQRLENREQRLENREQRLENREQRLENREQMLENRERRLENREQMLENRERRQELAAHAQFFANEEQFQATNTPVKLKETQKDEWIKRYQAEVMKRETAEEDLKRQKDINESLERKNRELEDKLAMHQALGTAAGESEPSPEEMDLQTKIDELTAKLEDLRKEQKKSSVGSSTSNDSRTTDGTEGTSITGLSGWGPSMDRHPGDEEYVFP